MAIIIPIRKYLTYGELRERWQCSDNDLRYVIVTEELKPSVKAFENLTIPSWSFDDDDIEKVIPEGEMENAQNGYTLQVRPNGWLFLQDPKQTGPLACEFRLATHERNPDKPKEVWDIPFASWFWLPYPMTIDVLINEAVFMIDEVCRYEAAHDKDAVSEQMKKPIATTERNTLLTIIAALCKEAKLDYTKPAKTAGLIQSTAAGMGLSIGETTIEDHLKKRPNALAGRMK